MNLSPSRFYRGDTRFKGADGQTRPAAVYSYETSNVLYDVLIISGLQFVRVNCGPISNMISRWRPVHYAIAVHFNL